ncbi:MAG: hypothetical protein OEM26_16705 [Saprospiraceae bacterium]|nr:hypothetical protein [Saprospiraceae bacterium]
MKEHLPIFIIAMIGIIGLMTVHRDIKTQRQSIPILQRVDLMENSSSSVGRANLSTEILEIAVMPGHTPVFTSRKSGTTPDTVVGLEYFQ